MTFKNLFAHCLGRAGLYPEEDQEKDKCEVVFHDPCFKGEKHGTDRRRIQAAILLKIFV